LNGKGLEPTVDALIGIDGFFRDTMQKTFNYAADSVFSGNDVMQRMFPSLWNNIKTQQVFQIDEWISTFCNIDVILFVLVYHSCTLLTL